MIFFARRERADRGHEGALELAADDKEATPRTEGRLLDVGK
jgi:hypothetical protein